VYENAMTRAMAACVEAGVPVLLWGDPGQGKTARIEQLGQAWGRHVETISASSREAVDFMGLPMEQNGRVVYSPLSWAVSLNASSKGLLFIDEFTTAGAAQKALLRVVNERIVGEFALGEHVSVIAAANPPEVAVDGMDLAAPTANRFIMLDWVFDRQLWLDNVGTSFAEVPTADPKTYLAENTPEHRARVVQLVTAFLRARPDLASKVPQSVEDQGRAWPSPRSWTNVIEALCRLRIDDEDARDLIVRGGVGEAVATEFLAWAAANDLSDPEEVLNDPSIVDWAGERPDRVFALLGGIDVIVRLDGGKKRWEQGVQVAVAAAAAGRPDAALNYARSLIASPHSQGGIPSAFREAFVDLFQRAGVMRAA